MNLLEICSSDSISLKTLCACLYTTIAKPSHLTPPIHPNSREYYNPTWLNLHFENLPKHLSHEILLLESVFAILKNMNAPKETIEIMLHLYYEIYKFKYPNTTESSVMDAVMVYLDAMFKISKEKYVSALHVYQSVYPDRVHEYIASNFMVDTKLDIFMEVFEKYMNAGNINDLMQIISNRIKEGTCKNYECLIKLIEFTKPELRSAIYIGDMYYNSLRYPNLELTGQLLPILGRYGINPRLELLTKVNDLDASGLAFVHTLWYPLSIGKVKLIMRDLPVNVNLQLTTRTNHSYLIGDTPLHVMLKSIPNHTFLQGHVDCVELLLRHPNIDVTIRNSVGKTALQCLSFSLVPFYILELFINLYEKHVFLEELNEQIKSMHVVQIEEAYSGCGYVLK